MTKSEKTKPNAVAASTPLPGDGAAAVPSPKAAPDREAAGPSLGSAPAGAPALWRRLAESIHEQERQRAAAVAKLRVLPPSTAPSASAPDRGSRQAFTLLELLLAVAIFALVLLAMHYVFYGALKLRNKTNDLLEATVPMQQAVALVRRDVLNLVPPGGTLAGQFQSLPTSTSNTLTSLQNPLAGRRVSPDLYTASANLDETSPWSEVQKVYYLLSPATNDTPGLDLYRVVTRNLLPSFQEEPELQWLLGGVEDMLFEFYDGTEWRDSWDSTVEATPLPQAIKVQIVMLPELENRFRPQPVELVLPIVVQSRTNQTASAEGDDGA